MAVELRTLIANELKITLPVTFLFNYPTIRDMSRYLIGELKSDVASGYTKRNVGGDGKTKTPDEKKFEKKSSSDVFSLTQAAESISCDEPSNKKDAMEFIEELNEADLVKLIEKDLESL